MGDASSRGWGKGWPTDRSADMATASGGGISIPAHKRIAPIVSWLLAETVRRGYDLDGTRDDWGYANRPIRGTQRPSNHSWGLAVDLNATANPMQSKLKTDMPRWMVGLWKSHGFDWGGDYDGRKDAMHFEFAGTPADADRIAKTLGAAPKPKPPAKTTTTPPPKEVELMPALFIDTRKTPSPIYAVPGDGTKHHLTQRELDLCRVGGALPMTDPLKIGDQDGKDWFDALKEV